MSEPHSFDQVLTALESFANQLAAGDVSIGQAPYELMDYKEDMTKLFRTMKVLFESLEKTLERE